MEKAANSRQQNGWFYPIMKHYDKATRDKRYEEFKKRWDIDDGEHDE